MNPFEVQLMSLDSEAAKIQEEAQRVQHKQMAFNENLKAFLKEHGLPENFTLPQLALLAIRQARK